MADRDAGLPADARIEIRIGVNMGDLIIDGDVIYGERAVGAEGPPP
ncbi:MAG: hypothetical protein JJ897_00130 [Marinibacterium sp.]|nr:hypothetical protein [Marinibacterium sp.]